MVHDAFPSFPPPKKKKKNLITVGQDGNGMPGFQYNTLMVYELYRETGGARSASPLMANTSLAHRVY